MPCSKGQGGAVGLALLLLSTPENRECAGRQNQREDAGTGHEQALLRDLQPVRAPAPACLSCSPADVHGHCPGLEHPCAPVRHTFARGSARRAWRGGGGGGGQEHGTPLSALLSTPVCVHCSSASPPRLQQRTPLAAAGTPARSQGAAPAAGTCAKPPGRTCTQSAERRERPCSAQGSPPAPRSLRAPPCARSIAGGSQRHGGCPDARWATRGAARERSARSCRPPRPPRAQRRPTVSALMRRGWPGGCRGRAGIAGVLVQAHKRRRRKSTPPARRLPPPTAPHLLRPPQPACSPGVPRGGRGRGGCGRRR